MCRLVSGIEDKLAFEVEYPTDQCSQFANVQVLADTDQVAGIGQIAVVVDEVNAPSGADPRRGDRPVPC